MNSLIKLIIVAVASNLFKVITTTQDHVHAALKGRTYFAPKQVVTGRNEELYNKQDEAVEEEEYFDHSVDYEDDLNNFYDSSDCEDSVDSSDCEDGRKRPILVPRISYQRPWCPGQVMASLIPRAMDPIYDWRYPATCDQFASNFGGISVIVGEVGGPNFCTSGPSLVFSNYTINRSMSINEPIYARATGESGNEFAVAAGPIMYPRGNVLYISVAKEVAKLPQNCERDLYLF